MEDVRKVLQDVLAPELREQKARLDAIDQELKETRETLKEMRAEIKAMRAETSVAFKDMRAETSAALREMRAESKSDLFNLRVEIKADFTGLQTQAKADRMILENKIYEQGKDLIAEMKLGFREVRSDMRLSERVDKIEKTMSAEQQH